MTLGIAYLLALSACALGAVLPTTTGPYGVNWIDQLELVEQSSSDPFAPTPTPRTIWTSIFYPSSNASDCNPQVVPYMPPAIASYYEQNYSAYPIPSNTFTSAQLSLCASSAATTHLPSFPLVLFSPGSKTSRLVYSALAQSISSAGYIVITLDSSDTSIVQLSNGSVFYGYNLSSTDSDVAGRVSDVGSLLSSLSIVAAALPSPHLLDPTRVAIMGHSLGGSTAAGAMYADARIRGGVSLDGGIVGPVLDAGFSNPFLLIRGDHNDSSLQPEWDELFAHLDWKREFLLLRSQHETFTDGPVLLQAAGLWPWGEALAAVVGAIEGIRAQEIVVDYVVAFLEMVLKCRPPGLLLGNSTLFPEMEVVV